MKELLDKLSSYNLFNYLLPGTIFAVVAERITTYRFPKDNIVLELFAYYFAGLIVSRIGSLVLEPLLRKLKFVEFAAYKDFIRASAKDQKIELLSEQNNMYRTLCALFVALPAFKLADIVAIKFEVSHRSVLVTGCVVLCLVFAFAYRKETQFVKARVEAA